MIRVFAMLGSLLLASLLVAGAYGADKEVVSEIGDETPDLREWGIHNNCISLHQIKNIRVKSDDLVFIELAGGKKVMMNFKNSCRGLKYNGYVHSTRTNDLCAKFDSIRVINRGTTCMIESFSPVTELDNQPVEP